MPPKLKQRGSAAGYLLMLILFVALHLIIAVQAFLTTPSNIRTRRAVAPPVPVTSTLSSDRSNPVGTVNHKSQYIGRRIASITLKAGLFGEQMKFKNQNQTYISPTSDWQIYVDQSRASLDRGGNETLDAFFSFCYTSVDRFDVGTDGKTQRDVEVQVIPAIIPKPATGGKAPWIRCIWNNRPKNAVRPFSNLDISNVDSVDKVYRVLTKHLGLTNISVEACECIKWKHKGNDFLESGEIKSAIYAYSQALETCEEAHATYAADPHSRYNSDVLKREEGINLLLRASAYFQQAQVHKETLQMVVSENEAKLPHSKILQELLSEAMTPPSPYASLKISTPAKPLFDDEDDAIDGTATGVNGNDVEGATTDSLSEEDMVTVEIDSKNEYDESLQLLSPYTHKDNDNDEDRIEIRDNDPQTAIRLSVLRMLKSNGKLRKFQLRKIQYRHGLYQASLLQATSDSLRATDVLPTYPTAWVQAGDLLSDLWQIAESKQYYEKALSIDESLEERLKPILEGLEARRELVNRARTKMMLAEDMLQLALDVAA